MRNVVAVVAGLIAVSAGVPYFLDTIRGKTRPSEITWFTWALLSGITAVAALSDNAMQTAIFAGAVVICDGSIVIAGLRRGFKKYTRFDIICQVLAIVGIVLWQITREPGLAVLFVIISDFIGALPTYRHILRKPYEETLSMFTLSSAAAVLTLLAIAKFNFVSTAYPAYILASAVSFVILILYSRRRAATKHSAMIKS